MQDIKDIIKAVENVYDNDTAFTILKDFERVLDQLDLYVRLCVWRQNRVPYES